jgi:alcohol dehydrogenase
VVLGAGKLGLLVAQVLQRAGADVVVSARHPAQGARADRLGLASREPAPGADLVVDATGTAEGLRQALALVRPRGTVVLKTTVASEHRLDLAPAVINEITVVGSRCGRFPPALEALAAGAIAVEPMIDAVVPLDEALAGFERAAAKGAMKIVLDARDA